MIRMPRLAPFAALIVSISAHAATGLFNAGGPAFQAGNVTYRADQLYTPQNGAGAIDGTATTLPIPQFGMVIEGTAYQQLYGTQREGLTEYRFDVPNGVYLLTLQFAELEQNGPNFRVFSVAAEGQTLLQNFDIYATVEKNYAITYQFAVPVRDGQLNVTFSASVGQTTIAAIGVAATTPDKTPPPTPVVTATGGYYRNILSWPAVSAPDIAGYLVYRSATATGGYSLLTPKPFPPVRYFDDAVSAGQTSYYRIAAVDVFGNVSAPSAAVSAAPRDISLSTLPVYLLSMTPGNLSMLEADPQNDDYVDGDFTFEGVLYPGIGVRFRGNSSREDEKKSWKINFSKNQEFGTKDKVNFKADAVEPSIMRECLGASIMAMTSALVENCGFAHFELNGKFLGVFDNVENIDQYFLSDRGLNASGKLFEANQAPLSNFQILPDYSVAWDDDSKNSDGYDTLAQFIETINNTSDADFPSVISSVLNVNSYLDYYASVILPADIDHTEHNFEMNLNPDSLVWEIIGKDFDANLQVLNCPINYGTSAQPEHIYGQYNILTDRLLKVPLFRQWYVNKLTELLNSDFTPAMLNPLIDSNHSLIAVDGDRDVYKRGRELNGAFDASPAGLKQFIAARIPVVQSQISAYTPGLTQPIMLNEVLAINVNGIVDENGQHSPWLEIFNPSSKSYNLSGNFLTNNPAVKTMWAFPSGTVVPPGGYVLVWLDGQTGVGPLHTNFTVSALGQALGLYGPNAAGNPLIDTIAFGPQKADVSFGRRFSGSWLWTVQTMPTPAGPNQSAAASRSVVQ